MWGEKTGSLRGVGVKGCLEAQVWLNHQLIKNNCTGNILFSEKTEATHLYNSPICTHFTVGPKTAPSKWKRPWMCHEPKLPKELLLSTLSYSHTTALPLSHSHTLPQTHTHPSTHTVKSPTKWQKEKLSSGLLLIGVKCFGCSFRNTQGP